MEEREAIQQLLVLVRLRTALVVLVGDVLKGAGEVGFEALGRLVGDLDAGLKDGNGELGRGCGGKP
jgi:hypothetical protein